MTDPTKLCPCGKRATHRVSNWNGNPEEQYFCCSCFVREGFSPSGWHNECIQTYNALHPSQEPLEVEDPRIADIAGEVASTFCDSFSNTLGGAKHAAYRTLMILVAHGLNKMKQHDD